PRPTGTSVDPPRGCGPAWERPGARPARMTTPRPTSTSVDPPRGCGPAWERPGARPARMSAPRPTGTSVDPPRGCGPAWERPGARPAVGLTQGVSRGLQVDGGVVHQAMAQRHALGAQQRDVVADDEQRGVAVARQAQQ